MTLVCLALVGAAGGSAQARGPFLLVSLPSLGTVTWRCGATPGTYMLALHVYARGATTGLRLEVSGRLVATARVDPGETWRSRRSGLAQQLELRQSTGAGTVRATVTARFDRAPVVSHCHWYSPPRLSVRVTPRR